MTTITQETIDVRSHEIRYDALLNGIRAEAAMDGSRFRITLDEKGDAHDWVEVCCWEGGREDWHTYSSVEAMREAVLFELRDRPDPLDTCGEDDPDCIARCEAVNALCRRAVQ